MLTFILGLTIGIAAREVVVRLGKLSIEVVEAKLKKAKSS